MNTMSELQIPTLHNLSCPFCGSQDLHFLGLKGAVGKSVAIGAAFGALGSIVASSTVSESEPTKPLYFKCKQCRKKFETYPLPAPSDEILATPCKISFQRIKSFAGLAVPYIVYLNGMRVGPIKNGESFQFDTNSRYNTLYVMNHHGLPFKSECRFEASAGATVAVQFKNKFVQ